MFEIDVQNDDEFVVDPASLQQAARVVLLRHDVDHESVMTVVITTDEAVHALNLQHRQVDSPTDVLSFPADPFPEELAELAELEAPYLGDLVIAYPYASAQAQRENHALRDSLMLLVVHGTLHLLGYDHDTPENRAEMWAEQGAALRELQIDEGIVPALEGSDHG
jgi:probable rRNA maturation factor